MCRIGSLLTATLDFSSCGMQGTPIQERWGGLSPFGRTAVKEMNRLGMVRSRSTPSFRSPDLFSPDARHLAHLPLDRFRRVDPLSLPSYLLPLERTRRPPSRTQHPRLDPPAHRRHFLFAAKVFATPGWRRRERVGERHGGSGEGGPERGRVDFAQLLAGVRFGVGRWERDEGDDRSARWCVWLACSCHDEANERS